MVIRQTRVLLWEELRELFTRKRSLFSLLAYAGFTLLVFSGLARAMARARQAVGDSSILEQPRILVEQFGRSMSPEAYRVLEQLAQVPSPIVIYQCLSLVLLPTLVAMVSCDMVSVDISRGTLRYLLLRSRRSSYYLSKLAAHTVLYVVLHSVTMIGLLVVIYRSDPQFSLDAGVPPAVAYIAVTIPAIWLMVALTAWISSWCRSTMSALILIHLAWIVMFGVMAVRPAWTPFYHTISIGLVAPFGEFAADAIVGMSLWALALSVGGYAGFARRDV